MQLLKDIFQQAKTVLKFVWRHFFSLINGYIGLSVLLTTHSISIKNGIMLMIGAAILDWIKMKFKPIKGYNPAYDQMMAFARSEMDSSNYGSCAWMSNPMQTGSMAWNSDPYAPGSSAYYTRINNERINRDWFYYR